MNVRVVSPAEYDRHEGEVLFVASVDGQSISVTSTLSALGIVREALGIDSTDPLVIYAAGGKLLEVVVADIIRASGEKQLTYFMTHRDVLRVTGALNGLPHVPKSWRPT